MFLYAILVHKRELESFKLGKKTEMEKNTKPKPALKTFPCALDKNS